MKNKNFYYAIASLIGATIGVGIFGIPYVVAKTGFIWGTLSLIFLGLVSLLINLLYGEVVLATKENHRLVGYAKKYLNKWEQKIAIFALIFSCYGSMLAYLIVGGEFLHILFNGFFGFDAFTYTLFFFAVSSYLIFLGLKIVAKGELIMTYFLLLTIIVLFVKCAGSIEPTNLATLNLSDWFLPYGVILFALNFKFKRLVSSLRSNSFCFERQRCYPLFKRSIRQRPTVDEKNNFMGNNYSNYCLRFFYFFSCRNYRRNDNQRSNLWT
jgi:amino acid permease